MESQLKILSCSKLYPTLSLMFKILESSLKCVLVYYFSFSKQELIKLNKLICVGFIFHATRGHYGSFCICFEGLCKKQEMTFIKQEVIIYHLKVNNDLNNVKNYIFI